MKWACPSEERLPTHIDFLAHESWPPLLSASSKPSSLLSWIIAIASCFFLTPVGLFLTPCPKRSYKKLDHVTLLFKGPIFSHLASSKSLPLCLSDLTSWYVALPHCTPASYISGMVKYAPRGLSHLLFMQLGPPPPRYSHGPSLTSFRGTLLGPRSLFPISHPSFIFLHRTHHHLKTVFSPPKYHIIFIVCLSPLECELPEVWIFALSIAWHNDWFLVNTGVSAFHFPFSSPTRAHRTTFREQGTYSYWKASFPKREWVVTGFSSIWATCFYKEVSPYEVNHQRVWSLSYKSPTPPPLSL